MSSIQSHQLEQVQQLEPFDHVILTAPTILIASQYHQQLDSIRKYFKHTQFHCVSDPCNKRVGSGGGTLNALDYIASIYGIDKISSSKLLIIHSGGESKRSPIHSVCGKAWASLN